MGTQLGSQKGDDKSKDKGAAMAAVAPPVQLEVTTSQSTVPPASQASKIVSQPGPKPKVCDGPKSGGTSTSTTPEVHKDCQ
jgi:hypothetical protein